MPDGEGTVPSERVRKMEVSMNEGVDIYRDLYVMCPSVLVGSAATEVYDCGRPI